MDPAGFQILSHNGLFQECPRALADASLSYGYFNGAVLHSVNPDMHIQTDNVSLQSCGLKRTLAMRDSRQAESSDASTIKHSKLTSPKSKRARAKRADRTSIKQFDKAEKSSLSQLPEGQFVQSWDGMSREDALRVAAHNNKYFAYAHYVMEELKKEAAPEVSGTITRFQAQLLANIQNVSSMLEAHGVQSDTSETQPKVLKSIPGTENASPRSGSSRLIDLASIPEIDEKIDLSGSLDSGVFDMGGSPSNGFIDSLDSSFLEGVENWIN
ncbi:hypothetical protein EOPP23_11865 [Endozoicomonas sp. OPT23]|uniref:hypothetical protein n=1 Tax=Endozoicomonas sp. OPT23 TaxID=2072845 RepID=UPI00129AA19A|nr:hypothetical protein [Endozoicomonas sp. OPT23]MRI33682.1 hypothetical protein [Endozoicomonas sp. OPT23]